MAEPAWQSGDRIMFVGDSITDAKLWTAYLTAYLHMRNPTLGLHITSYGRGGADTADFLYADDPNAGPSHGGAGYQNWPRIVAPMQADWHIIMLGQNPSTNADNFDLVYRTLLDDYATGNVIIVAPWPSTSTTGGTLDTYEAKLATIATDYTLPFFNTWTVLEPIWTEHFTFTIDATTNVCTATGSGYSNGDRVYVEYGTAPTGETDGTKFVRDVSGDTFKLANTEGGAAVDFATAGSGHIISAEMAKLQFPGTQNQPTGHQGTTGHAVLGMKMLTTLDWGGDVFEIVLTAAGAETSADHCTSSNRTTNAFGGIDFDLLPARLPWAYDRGANNRTYTDAVSLVPEFAGWQTAIIKITGLSSGTYDIYMDGGIVASVSHTDLNAGWNVSDLTLGPIYDKCSAILPLIRAQLGVQNQTGDFAPPLNTALSPLKGMEKFVSAASARFNAGDRDAVLAAAVADERDLIDALDADIHTAATPETIAVSVRRQGAAGDVPVINITVPASPPTEEGGTPITFTAVATDTEDGTISANTVWASDIDGALGTGASISPVLSLGGHTITATITDSDTNQAFAQIGATITGSTLQAGTVNATNLIIG